MEKENNITKNLLWVFFFVFRYQNSKMHTKHSYRLLYMMHFGYKNVRYVFFFFKLVTYQKSSNMRNALYGETEQRCQKRVLGFFFFSSMLGTKITKHMQSILFELTKRHSQRCVISVFFEHISHKKSYKKHWKHSLSKTRLLSVFELLPYQKSKAV